MATSINKKEFLTQNVPDLLKKLQQDTAPSFGLMTPQHMAEHLAGTVKSTIKRYGEPEIPPTDKQLAFQRFIKSGSILQHRPSNKTEADLPALKYGSLGEAIAQVSVGVERFYGHYDTYPDFKCYNHFFGELGFDDLELFHYMHIRYHLWQFGLLENYP